MSTPDAADRTTRNPWTDPVDRAVYENPWIRVREDQVIRPDGLPGIYGVVEFKNRAVGVLPVEDDGSVWLVGPVSIPARSVFLGDSRGRQPHCGIPRRDGPARAPRGDRAHGRSARAGGDVTSVELGQRRDRVCLSARPSCRTVPSIRKGLSGSTVRRVRMGRGLADVQGGSRSPIP